MCQLKRSLRSVLEVDEKAASRLPTNSEALVPVMAITTLEAFFLALTVWLVRHLSCDGRASPGLKVVSSVAIGVRVWPEGYRALMAESLVYPDVR